MQQDWLMGLAGGLLIGGAAALYLLVNGRILGASGIFAGLLDGWSDGRDAWTERAAFLAGLIVVPLLLPLAAKTHITASLPVILAGGLLVGIGTRLANGCTSGHGVCGISRLAPRGIVATLLYLVAGGVVMAVARHLWGLI